MGNSIEEFIRALESLTIAQESTLQLFMNDPFDYIDHYQYKDGATSRDNTESLRIINTDGEIYLQVMQACDAFCKVNAYASAISLLNAFLDRLFRICEDVNTPEDWKILIDSTKKEVYNYRLKVLEKQDNYESGRSMVMARYEKLLKSLQDHIS